MNISLEDQMLLDSQNEDFPIKFNFLGREFILQKNVFSPKAFMDYHLYVPQLPLKQGQSMLDMGCGTGVVGITACLQNNLSYVVFADISEEAVQNTKENIKLYNLADKTSIFQSDVFSNIPKDEKFDLIFWNFPYFDSEKENPTLLDICSYDPGYKNVKKFVLEGWKKLNLGGKIILGFSSSRVSLDKAREYMNEIGFDIDIFFQTSGNDGINQELLNIVKLK